MRRRSTKSRDSAIDLQNLLKHLDADFLIRSLDAKTWQRFNSNALGWEKRCEEVIRARYWSDGSWNPKKVRCLAGENYMETFNRHEDEAISICQDELIRFVSRTKFAMRRLVENMQRCVLRGLPPVPIAVESESSILRRWRRLVRIKLNIRLASLMSEDSNTAEAGPPKKPAKKAGSDKGKSEQLDPSEEAAINEEVEVICSLLKSPKIASSEGLKKFHELAHSIEGPAWFTAMDELDQAEPDRDCVKTP